MSVSMILKLADEVAEAMHQSTHSDLFLWVSMEPQNRVNWYWKKAGELMVLRVLC